MELFQGQACTFPLPPERQSRTRMKLLSLLVAWIAGARLPSNRNLCAPHCRLGVLTDAGNEDNVGGCWVESEKLGAARVGHPFALLHAGPTRGYGLLRRVPPVAGPEDGGYERGPSCLSRYSIG